MLRPPSLKFLPYYPVTSGVAIAAVIVTTMLWSKQDISPFLMDDHVWNDWQLWRPLAATLPHANFIHIAFNLYWLWTFGTLIERVYGHVKCLAIYVFLGFGSMLADFAVSNGGIGLSGIGYGLWGLLMVLESRDARFIDAVDRGTNQTFIVWFFLCIVLTVTDFMPVANVAHGAGAVLGMLLGLAIEGSDATKWKSRAALVALTILIFLGGTIYWPYINLSKYAAWNIEDVALNAMERGDNSRGAKLLEIAVHKRNVPPRIWYNLGVAYERTGQREKAASAFQHAASMPNADAQILNAAEISRRQLILVNTNR